MNVYCAIKIYIYCINKLVSKIVVKDITHLMLNVFSAVTTVLIVHLLTTVHYANLIISMILTVWYATNVYMDVMNAMIT